MQAEPQTPATQVGEPLTAPGQSLGAQQLPTGMQLLDAPQAFCPEGQAQGDPGDGHVSPVTVQSLSVQQESDGRSSPPSGALPPSKPLPEPLPPSEKVPPSGADAMGLPGMHCGPHVRKPVLQDRTQA